MDRTFFTALFLCLSTLCTGTTADPGYLLHEDLIPWQWRVRPDDGTPLENCPLISETLGTFAAVNIITSFLAIPFGNRLLMNALSCGILGKKFSKSWKYLWPVTVGLHLLANLLVALVIQRVSGFGTGFRLVDLTFFYTTRPRLSFLLLPLFFYRAEGQRKRGRGRRFTDVGRRASPDVSNEKGDRPWGSATLQMAIAELVLQACACYYMGTTAHFASSRGYLTLYADLGHHGVDARIMYGGALLYLISAPCCLLLTLISIAGGHTSPVTHWADFEVFPIWYLLVIGPGLWLWIGSWLFWAGFVRLADNLYCPPKLSTQGAIWTAFSLLGVAIGTGA